MCRVFIESWCIHAKLSIKSAHMIMRVHEYVIVVHEYVFVDQFFVQRLETFIRWAYEKAIIQTLVSKAHQKAIESV